jgi:pyruvate/2-oxoglutarate dehydrogenase complex dihydrolipoamide acyltransferase (E2) component
MARAVLKLPKLAVSMQEGTIVEWLVEAGARVSVGQPIFTVESEKSSLEVESPFAGVFHPTAELGQTYPVGTPVAEIVS